MFALVRMAGGIRDLAAVGGGGGSVLASRESSHEHVKWMFSSSVSMLIECYYVWLFYAILDPVSLTETAGLDLESSLSQKNNYKLIEFCSLSGPHRTSWC